MTTQDSVLGGSVFFSGARSPRVRETSRCWGVSQPFLTTTKRASNWKCSTGCLEHREKHAIYRFCYILLYIYLGGGFKCFLFSPLFEEYISRGLKPTTRYIDRYIYIYPLEPSHILSWWARGVQSPKRNAQYLSYPMVKVHGTVPKR